MTERSHEHNDEAFEGFTKEELKENFSALASELEEGGEPLGKLIQKAQQRNKGPKKTEQPPYFRGYDPTIKDFLARATSVEECEEIIEYCLKEKTITEDEAREYRRRLDKGGPRAFGTRKPGYYDQKL